MEYEKLTDHAKKLILRRKNSNNTFACLTWVNSRLKLSPHIFCSLVLLCMTELSFAEQYIRLPDGQLFPVKQGESAQEAWDVATKLYPKAFGLLKIPNDKKMDLNWFNDCKLKAAITPNSAIGAAVEACKYKATPKKCRALKIDEDALGNEFGDARVQCVEQCRNANYYSKSVGECSKG